MLIKFCSTDDMAEHLDVAPIEICTDFRQIQKRGGSSERFRYVKVAKNQEPVHLIALGSDLINRNSDFFKEADCKSRHSTFKKAGRAVNWNHKNKPSDPKYGNIYDSDYNEGMKRIELLVGLDKNNPKNEKTLQDLSQGKQASFSMACTSDPNTPILTSRGYRNIVDVEVGDEVLTHLGNWKKVTHLNRYNYSGKMFKFRVQGLPFWFQMTSNHPFWASILDSDKFNNCKVKRYFRDTENFEKIRPSWAHTSHLKVGDRIYYQPINKPFKAVPGIGDVRLAQLMGYYTAEGALNENTISFCHNILDSLPKVIPKIIEELWPGVTTKIIPHRLSKVCFNLQVYSVELTHFIRHYCGKLAKKKFISQELFNSLPEVKKAFLGAWMDGDGFVDKKGLHWSSANKELILQGRDLLMSIGIASSIYAIDHSKCKSSGHINSGWEYTLNVSHIDTPHFQEFSDKAKNSQYYTPEYRTKPASLRSHENGLYSYRVKEIEEYEVLDTPVYNLEVQDDESYIMAGLVSHNCKVPYDICTICKHKAKDASSRCNHIPSQLGEITKEGIAVAMDNVNPDWFEISLVHKPADRIAYSLNSPLSKHASFEKSAQGRYYDNIELAKTIYVPPLILSKQASSKRALLNKLSKLEKRIEAQGSKPEPYIKEVSEKLNKAPQLSDSTIKELREFDHNQLLKALADKGIIFTAEEFFKYLFQDKLQDNDKGILSNIKTKLPTMFSDFDNDEELNCEDFEPSEKHAPLNLLGLVNKLFEGHSLFPAPTHRRIISITIIKPKTQEIQKQSSVHPGLKEFVEAFVTKYASYKLSALAYLEDKNKIDDELLINSIIQNRR